MKSIFNYTLLLAGRQKYLQVLSAILLFLFVIVAFNGVIAHKTKLQNFEVAKQEVRKSWLNQGQQNPHNSAHYGHYVFQPVGAMQFLDNGVRAFTGTVIRLEAHAQNEATFSPAQDRTELSRFSELNFAWLLQVLIPLFVIIVCFNAVSTDRENQNLKLLASQGISNSSYLWGKILANYSIILGISALGLLTQLVAYITISEGDNNFSISTLSFWFCLYVVYLLVITTLSTLVSAWSKQSKTSLVVQIVSWVLLVIIMPKITANVGGKLFPLEHKYDFKNALREDRNKGINGHDPEDKRAIVFQDSLLKHYKVKTVKELPVNADGLVMQADENYANLIYDKHFGRIRNTISAQNSISKWSSFVNPYLAIRNSSMSLSGSDFNSQLDLYAQAEIYRRYLINELNTKMAYGGSKTDDWDWKVPVGYWETVRDFDYSETSLSQSIQNSKVELLAMAAWLLVIMIGVFFTSKNLSLI